MRVSIIAPEYFPRQSILALALHADRLVLADTFSYKRRSYQNRTRIRTPQGWHWARIPLWGRQHGNRIEDVGIDNNVRWLTKHWRSLQFNYRSTPYFEFYEPHIEDFFQQEWEKLGATTCRSVEMMLGLLDRQGVAVRASSFPGRPSTPKDIIEQLDEEPTELLIVGEQDLSEIPLQERYVLRYEEPRYEQNFDGFEEGMTALDIIFNHGPDAARMVRQGGTLELLK